MADAKGRRVKVELNDGSCVDGYVYSSNTHTGKLSLEKVEIIENGKRKKVVGLQHYFADEIKSVVITEDVSKVKKKKTYGRDGHESMLREKCASTHLEKLKFIEPSSMVLKSIKSEALTLESDSDDEVLQSSDEYTLIPKLCTTFYEAVEHIKKFQVIGVAMEGIAIGRFGRLCWLQIAVPAHVFLFDILKMGKACFDKGLKDILENDEILKVLHDCRMASDMLHHQYNISLINVFDTQVANVFVYRLRHHNDWPRHVEGLAACLVTHLDLSLEDINFAVVREQRREEDESVWLERPPQRHLVDAAIKNVKHLLDLRTVLMEKMMEEYVAGVNIYLMHVRDASDSDSKRYRTTGHLLPVAFQDIRVFMSSYRGRNPHYSTSTVPKDLSGFRENCTGIKQPGVYFSKDSIWHGGYKQNASEKVVPKYAMSVMEEYSKHNRKFPDVLSECTANGRGNGIGDSKQTVSESDERPNRDKTHSSDSGKVTPRQALSILELQNALDISKENVWLSQLESEEVISKTRSVLSRRNIHRSPNNDLISQTVAAMNASKLANSESETDLGELTQLDDLSENAQELRAEGSGRSELKGGSLMRALVYQQDASGYETNMNIDSFNLKPAGGMVCNLPSGKKKKKTLAGMQDESVLSTKLRTRIIPHVNNHKDSKDTPPQYNPCDDLRPVIPGGDLVTVTPPPRRACLTPQEKQLIDMMKKRSSKTPPLVSSEASGMSEMSQSLGKTPTNMPYQARNLQQYLEQLKKS